MKLFRFGPRGAERPGVVRGDAWLDVSAFGEDFGEAFFGSHGLARLGAWLDENHASCPRVDRSERLGPPISRPSKILCIGRNYRAHAAETGADVPTEPVVFMKATSALAGPNDDVHLPRGSQKTDWEVELAVVIGQGASYVTEEQALGHVAGFALHNDYSEREYQLERGGQWVKGKSADGFAPLGPLLVTRDEIDFRDLKLWLKVNGELRQSSSTAHMIFDVPTLVSYVSRFMTLLPGDVISTGTPDGVGLGCQPPVFLKAFDVVELGIEGLGSARQRIVPFEPLSSSA
jgi:2-keto-4-pentenoate hydratase/2-oxohepta-3-ene-1,7-dioic acid hydratase in catechol pathway